MKNQNKMLEAVTDLFDKNIDPLVLHGRMSQAARTRDLALEAAKNAEKAGKQELADKLRNDAEMLQQIIDLTRQSANLATGVQGDSKSGHASNKSSPQSGQNTEEDEDDTETPTDSELESDVTDLEDEDEDNFSDEDETELEDRSAGELDAASDDSETEDSTSAPASQDENEEETEDEDGEGTGSEKASEEADNSTENSDKNKATDTNNSSDASEDSAASSSKSEDTSNSSADDLDTSAQDTASDSDEDDYDDNAYGAPQVKDDIILQDPFANGQIQPEMPQDMQDALANGSLKIEEELEAIIRIISKLKGEARRGAEQAIKDYYGQRNPWGDINREEN